MELFKASNQWSTRPADERFATLADMLNACRAYAEQAKEVQSTPSKMRVEALSLPDHHLEPMLIGESGRAARLTNWAFKQLCQRSGAPAEYLQAIPAELAARNLNYGMQQRSKEHPVKLLMHVNGSNLLRAITGMGYKRFWNWNIVEGLERLEEHGWRVPPARPAFANQPGTRPATLQDVLRAEGFGLSIRVGDAIAPAGLYASDHDMFAFMVNEDKRIAVPGNPAGLCRGFFVEHSEVGDCSYTVTLFLYENVCGNHIVWGASKVTTIRIPHVGDAIPKIAEHLTGELSSYADSSSADEEERIRQLSQLEIGASKAEVVKVLFAKRLLSMNLANRAYDACEQEQSPVDGSNPRTPWGIVQGLTRLSQLSAYADQRSEIDRQAGKLLEVF